MVRNLVKVESNKLVLLKMTRHKRSCAKYECSTIHSLEKKVQMDRPMCTRAIMGAKHPTSNKVQIKTLTLTF